MTTITATQRQAIEQIVTPDRVRFDVRERRVYSHDTGVLPGPFRLLAGPSLADGVVQPETEQQVVQLVRFALEHGIPLVPRGKATSGYGGVVPAQGGLVLDLTRLKGIVWADPQDLTVTVRAGTVWNDLEEALAAYGLALRMYPTSAPASTLGGWLAQGGAGIGSHAYGWFADNVLAARIVTGTGEIREAAGAELAAISEAEGTTGIITEVTFAVRPAGEIEQTAVAFPGAEQLTQAVRLIGERKLPIWSITFLNPTMAQLKNAGPPKTHQGHPEPAGPSLPESEYVALFAYDAERSAVVLDGLREISLATGGRRLPAAIARLEWAERFKPMRLKRLGPSIVPAEIVVPLENLPAVLDELTKNVKAPLAIEGLSVRGMEIVLLGFIPHDERTPGYTFGYGFALSAIRAAERHGDLVQDRGFGTFPPFEIMAAALKGQKNIWGGLQENRDQWITAGIKPAIKDAAKIGYFAGCTASFVEQDIAQSAAKLLDAAGVEFTTLGKDEMCCGIPMLVAGKWELFEEALRHNSAAMQAKGVEEVVTSCPACWLVWNTYYPQWADKLGIPFDFKAKHYSQVLSEKISTGEFALTEVPESLKAQIEANGTAKVTFHDSCHIGRAGGVYEPPRDLIRAIPNVELVEMAHSKEDALCCGSVLTRIGEPHPTSEKLGGKRIGEAEATGADALLALCPCCQFQLRVSADEKGIGVAGHRPGTPVGRSAGSQDLPDPNPEVLRQWAMFEKFIALMSPDGMLAVMGALTPQLVDAMPLGMGGMMRSIGKAPAVIREPVFSLMTPLMPRLFPVLLPGMMPKVLPDMIALVEREIRMPDYLRQQLPDLFPEVVDNVMPKMLPDIAPKYVPVLFDYLRS